MNKRPPTQFTLTVSDHEALQSYLSQLPRFTRISPDEECEHFWQISNGDTQASTHVISATLRLVVKIAKSYAGRGVPLEDLKPEGSTGLMVSLGIR
jgi:DNA-directed RNA polymerase sigma subunit (sigma70/sigma32)